MSVVTNIILSFSTSENSEEKIAIVNSFECNGHKINLVSADFNKDMEKRTVWYGGTKFLEAELFIGAFNHFKLPDFVTHLKNINWESPECVQVIVKEQNDDKFKIIEIV